MEKVKAEAYECIDREREKVKHEFHLRKNANQHRQEVERHLKRSEDVSMYQFSRIKSAEEDQY